TAVVTRMSHDPETRAYVERRAGEHRTKAEIRRCLKRYLARRIFRTLNSTPEPTMAA
ncbi:IS110 family transposase, partial [Georgenia sp. Z1344]